jgi:hypothetical protein
MKSVIFAFGLSSAAALVLSCSSDGAIGTETHDAQQAALAPCTEGAGSSSGGASAGNAGANTTSGAGGMSGGQGPTYGGAATFMPGPPYTAPAHQNNLIHIKNACSFPLWLHGDGGGGVLMPDNQKVEAGATFDYTRGDWPFAWIDAFLDGPQQNRIERAELTFFPGSYVSYKLGYIDGIGLPMELQAMGPGADCNKAVACYATQAQIMASCPDGLLSGKRCLSAGEYCKDAANAAKPFCHVLDAPIAQCAASVPGCADAAGVTTAQAYRCDKAFGDKPKLCAAINRGSLADPNNAVESSFYGAAPHNHYAAWLHALCPGLATFPYDDANLPSDSFHTCIDPDGGTQLNITFCPAG